MSRHTADTRTKILQSTVDSLEKSGGRGVRMGDIAKATGISRQAVYLHFATRTELLVAAVLYRGEMLEVEKRLAPSRQANSGIERIHLYIDFWGNYLPEFYGVAKALMMAQDTDPAAAAAWRDRMLAMKDGCRAAIDALHADGSLAKEWTKPKATDALWTLLQVPNWEHLTIECGWSNKDYVRWIKVLATRAFIKD